MLPIGSRVSKHLFFYKVTEMMVPGMLNYHDPWSYLYVYSTVKHQMFGPELKRIFCDLSGFFSGPAIYFPYYTN